MKLSQFKFKLPEELIAMEPKEMRDESKLMVINRKTGEIQHHVFKDILNILTKAMCLYSTTQWYFRLDSTATKKKLALRLKYSFFAS